ncbi:protein DpdG [Thermopolyspora sp. NPDC052614]|uniref:protein DpdG n=1 Tax=Thermopolyspora sp. NPDC052614 TaxID=3155682 RepID=UPI0034203B0C
MTLINTSASIPNAMWATVRMFTTPSTRYQIDDLLLLLSPPSVHKQEEDAREKSPARRAVDTLQELGILEKSGDEIKLSVEHQELAGATLRTFLDRLRMACLATKHNDGLLGESDRGALDLTRALAWFLTQDPMGRPLGWAEVQVLQSSVDWPSGLVFSNDTRWVRFTHWAPALGFSAQSTLFGNDVARTLIPDCTAAVRATCERLWPTGARLQAEDFVAHLAAELPVLPEGEYARQLGLSASDPRRLSPVLSFALLSGRDEGWISLIRRQDSQRDVVLVDADRIDRAQRVTDIEVHGSNGE